MIELREMDGNRLYLNYVSKYHLLKLTHRFLENSTIPGPKARTELPFSRVSFFPIILIL